MQYFDEFVNLNPSFFITFNSGTNPETFRGSEGLLDRYDQYEEEHTEASCTETTKSRSRNRRLFGQFSMKSRIQSQKVDLFINRLGVFSTKTMCFFGI